MKSNDNLQSENEPINVNSIYLLIYLFHCFLKFYLTRLISFRLTKYRIIKIQPKKIQIFFLILIFRKMVQYSLIHNRLTQLKIRINREIQKNYL
jgi:hypothetical protein